MGQKTCRVKVATADALSVTGDSELHGFVVQPDGTNDVTFEVYDGVDNTGTKILPSMTFAGDGGTQSLQLPAPIQCFDGIYVDITLGAGAVEYAMIYKNGV